MSILPELSEKFGVNVGELLDIPIHKDTSELSEDEIALLTLYRKTCVLSPKQRIALARTLESVIELYIGSAAPKTKRGTRKSGE